MKIRLASIIIPVLTLTIVGLERMEIGSTNPILTPSKPIDGKIKVDPNKIKLYSNTTISGEVIVKFDGGATPGSLDCNKLSVNLYRDASLPVETMPGGFPMSAAPFSVSSKLTGNLNTGKCRYGISADPQYIGRKARLKFSGGGNPVEPPTDVTIPSQPLKLNLQVTFVGIVPK